VSCDVLPLCPHCGMSNNEPQGPLGRAFACRFCGGRYLVRRRSAYETEAVGEKPARGTGA
jgi:DNA-directed RNA polymerase subunit RPC12/RpoP